MKDFLTKFLTFAMLASCIAVGVIVLLFHRDDTAREYEEILLQADAYMQKGYYVEALACMKKAEKIKENVEVEKKIAEAYYNIEEFQNFINIANAVQSKTGGDESMYVLLGRYYLEHDLNECAIEVLKEGHELFAGNQDLANMYNQIKGGYTVYYRTYECISAWKEEMMAVREHDKWTLINASIYTETNKSYDAIYDISNDEVNRKIWKEDNYILSACVDGVAGYYDSNGNFRLSPEIAYSYLGCFHDGLALVKKENVWGYIDDTFAEVNMKFDDASAYAEGVAAVLQDGKWGLIDKEGNLVTEMIYDDVLMDEYRCCSIGGAVFFKKGDIYCMVDTKGNTVVDRLEVAKPFLEKNGYAAVKKDGKWCVLDHVGQAYLVGAYEELTSSSQGIVTYKENNKWGYASVTEGVYTEPVFVEARPVGKVGYAAVRQDNIYGLTYEEEKNNPILIASLPEGQYEVLQGTGMYTAKQEMVETEDKWTFIRFNRFNETDSFF